jgi:multiple sugar transport system substrate-binding protein
MKGNKMASFPKQFYGLAILSSLFFFSSDRVKAQTNLVSTQMRPIEEAEKMRNLIMKGAADKVNFVPEDPGTYVTRMQAELAAAQGKVHLTLALDGELAPINSIGGLLDLDELVKTLQTTREFSSSALSIAKLGGKTTKFIPFVTNTFQMAANKKALIHLPDGADINQLNWSQLIQWAKNIKAATGENKFGLPAGPKGLLHRFFQGYVYPAYTGGVVRTFKTTDAEKMWADLKELWTVTNPRSTSYSFMEEPLKTGEVWLAFDHTARLLPALLDKPEDFVAFPAPSGPKGRFFMPVITGLAIPKNTPDRAASERLIDHLTKPQTQALVLREIGFFPSVKAEVGALPKGVQIASIGVNNTFSGKDARAALLPVGLGVKSGEFNKVFIDTFTRIVVQNQDIKATLADQAKILEAVIKEAKAPCWAPDTTSGDLACPVQ